MTIIDWDKLIAEEKYVGGDMEAQEGNDVFRGPIKRIWKDGSYVHIEIEWCGKLADRQLPWRKWHITQNFFKVEGELAAGGRYDDLGRAILHIPMIGTIVLFPKGGSKLDASQVEGLIVSQIQGPAGPAPACDEGVDL